MNTWLNRFGFSRSLAILILAILLAMQLSIPCQADIRESLFVRANAEEILSHGVYFFGESTTAHLARRGGVLDRDDLRGHVLRDESGTRRLDRRILSSPVIIRENGVSHTVAFSQAVEVLQPSVLVLSFGLNGLVQFSRDPERFLADYRLLIEGVHARSPQTQMLLQSIYPVAQNDVFTADVTETNTQIQALNAHVAALEKEYPFVRFADSAPLLQDGNGMLCTAYDSGDGIHLTNDAYHLLLGFILKNIDAWQKEGTV